MEIERNPKTPKLSPRAIELLTELCFRKNDEPKKVDGIFEFSSTIDVGKLANLIEKLLSQGISQKVFITGGVAPITQELKIHQSEADLVLSLIDREKFKDVQFFIERKSTNTLENVAETYKNPEFAKCQSILFIFKAHGGGRGYLTLRKLFPKAKILQQTFAAKYPYPEATDVIARDNWHTFEFGRTRVWGEFLRIKTYGQRGDIEYNEVKKLVEEIDHETVGKEFEGENKI